MLPKFKTDDPFTNPGTAARELIRLCKVEMEMTGNPHAYTGTINNAFRLDGGGTVESYAAGRKFAVEKGWLMIDGSGTRITVTPDGEDA